VPGEDLILRFVSMASAYAIEFALALPKAINVIQELCNIHPVATPCGIRKGMQDNFAYRSKVKEAWPHVWKNSL
jgi:hypothetical protein